MGWEPGGSVIAALTSVGVRRNWPKGAVLLRQGESSEHVVVIERGKVKVASTAPSGKQVVLAFRGEGELVGEFSAIDERARSATVSALTEVTAVVATGSAFRDVLARHGEAALSLLRIVIGRLRESDARRLEFGAYPTAIRVARILLAYAEPGEGHEPAVSLSQTDLAHAVGGSREAVAKSLRQLRAQGVVRTSRGRIDLLRPDVLGQIASGASVYLDADGDASLR